MSNSSTVAPTIHTGVGQRATNGAIQPRAAGENSWKGL